MKTAGKLMAKSCSQLVNLPDARPLMNPLYSDPESCEVLSTLRQANLKMQLYFDG